MKLKRVLAAVLALCLCGSLWTAAPAARAADVSAAAFTDISDPAVRDAAELLRLLGVLNGVAPGQFAPDANLTRAQFCKMSVELRGEGDQAKALENYTFFGDVKGGHWARGYINYASRLSVGGGEERLVMGVGNGNFEPDANINFAQAVTMALRLLGYSRTAVASSVWPDGYITTARSIGLLEGLSAAPGDLLTRGQAAVLFQNLLFLTPCGGGETYFAALGGSVTGEVILLSVNATAQDGSTGAVETADGEGSVVRKTNHAPFDSSLEGRKVTLMLDKDGQVMDIQPVTSGTCRTVILAAHEINYITTAEGERVSIPVNAILYQGGDRLTYGEAYMDLKTGSPLTLSYAANGKLEYIYTPKTSSSADEAATRFTAVYEDASPSPRTPLAVQVLGQKLTVLDSAVEELAAFQPGDRITFLLTWDGRVAGAVKPSQGESALVGVVTAGDKETITVSPVLDLKNASGGEVVFSGPVASSAEKLVGELVELSVNYKGVLIPRKLGAGEAGALDIGKRTLGGKPLASQTVLYERTAGGKPVAIGWGQLNVSAVPTSQISYAGTNEQGQVNIIVLNDVTGDGYTYGFVKSRVEEVAVSGSSDFAPSSYDAYYLDVTNSGGVQPFRVPHSENISKAVPGGVAADVSGWGELVTLSELSDVPRSAFDMSTMTVRVGGVTYLISSSVQCYNEATGVWFAAGRDGVNAARAYSDTLTLYYDKTPEQGGKIRLIEVK